MGNLSRDVRRDTTRRVRGPGWRLSLVYRYLFSRSSPKAPYPQGVAPAGWEGKPPVDGDHSPPNGIRTCQATLAPDLRIRPVPRCLRDLPPSLSASPWLRINEVAARCFLSCRPIQAHAFCAGPTLRHLHQHLRISHSLLSPHTFVCASMKFLERLHVPPSPSVAIIAHFLFCMQTVCFWSDCKPVSHRPH